LTDAIEPGAENGGLHFHGFQHQEFVAFTDLVTDADSN
jgi:hypothetical protein